MYQPRVQKVNLPAATLVVQAFPHTDYADAYRMLLPAGRSHNLDTVVRAALGTAPRWISLLMRLRDRIVRLFGLKTARKSAPVSRHAPFQVGDTLGIFRVFARNADEVLLGEDDRHLDFRVSVLAQNDGTADWVIVATIVRFNSWLGRAYFLPVRSFHRLIVPAMLRNGYQHYPRADSTFEL